MAVSVAVILVVLLVPFIGAVNGKDEELNKCDIYNGTWVYDSSYPLYNSSQCKFIEMPFDCQQNGRPDHLYLKYRWKPHSCNLPRYYFFFLMICESLTLFRYMIFQFSFCMIGDHISS